MIPCLDQLMMTLSLKPSENAYLKKGVAEDPVVTPVMKETTTSLCRCKKKPCNCIRNNLVNGRPIEYNFPKLMTQKSVFPHYSLHTLMCTPEVFPTWPTPNYKYVETPHVVSASYQVVRECVPVSRRRKKREAPISPPKSTSSPLPNELVGENNTKVPARGRKYVCDTCKRAFDYKHVLQNHERTHTGEKPFACDRCSKKFTRDHHLKTHMRLHTGEKPYKCEFCEKLFVQVANLRRHIRVHTGERPYKCEYGACRSVFSDSNQLKAHVLIHTNVKPFVCPNCNQRYRRKHHLNGHKCSHENGYINSDAVIKNEQDVIMDEDEDSKCTLSDETVSNDSCLSAGYRIPSNGYHQPWIPTTSVMPTLTETINLNSLVMAIPVQTEPEDLSIHKKYRSTNNNNSSGSAGDSSRSTSPLDEVKLSPRSVQ